MNAFDLAGQGRGRSERRFAGNAWRRCGEALASKRIGAWAAGLALLATLHSLWSGLHFDDYFHRFLLLGLELPGAPEVAANPFGFVPGDEAMRRFIDLGVVPWWGLETLRMSFWRPLSSATHALDHALWPDSALAMHAHSLLWFALLALAVSGFYRRFLGPTWMAGLAALLYALDDARAIPAAWIANRNSLIVGVFCVLTLWAHDRWRRDAWRPGALLAPLLLGVALLAAEMGIGTLAYLASYALFLDRGPWRGRIGSLLGHAAVAATWLYVYHAAGHGVEGSGVYTSAVSEPSAFLAEFVLRFPILLLDQLGPPVSSLYAILSPGARLGFACAGAAACALAGLALAPLLRSDPVARFWALGCLLSFVPVTSAMPTSRLLLLPGLGAMGLIVQFLAFAYARRPEAMPGWRRRLATSCAALLVFFHAVVSPISLPLLVWVNTLETEATNALLFGVPLEDDVEQKTVVLVNPPFVPYAMMLSVIRLAAGLPAPRYLRVLAPGTGEVRVERPDPQTLVVTPSVGFLGGPLGTLFRAPEHPLRQGQSVEITGMSATVLALGSDDMPSVVRFRFDRALEHADLTWFACVDGRFVPFQLPEVGQTRVLQAAAGSLGATPSDPS